MKVLRGFLVSVCAMLSLNLIPVQEAKAGLILAPLTGGVSIVIGIGEGVLIGATGAKFLRIIGYKDMFRLWGVGLLLVGLDEKVENTKNNICVQLSARYPMIADQTLFEEIANLVMKSNQVEEFNYGVLEVRVSETDLRAILERTDATGIESDLEKLVTDLI